MKVDSSGTYTVEATDKLSGQSFIPTGKTEAAAIRNAIQLCNARPAIQRYIYSYSNTLKNNGYMKSELAVAVNLASFSR